MLKLSLVITKSSRNSALENVINHQMAGTMTFVRLVDPEALEVCSDLFTFGVNQMQVSLSTSCQPPHASRFLFPFLTACICRGSITTLSVKARLSLLSPSFPILTTLLSCYQDIFLVLFRKCGYLPQCT